MDGIPIAELFPPAFGQSGKPDWLLTPKDIPEDDSRRVFLASQIEQGFKYFTEKGEVRLSREFPKDYRDDIGYKYNHGPGKTDKNGNPLEERAKPTSFIFMRAWVVEDEAMRILSVDSWPLQEQMHLASKNPEFLMLPQGIANFYWTVYHAKNPSQKSLTYTAQASLRILRNDQAYQDAAKPWFPDNYFSGTNPFEAPAQPPNTSAAAVPAQPAMIQDSNGSQTPMAVRQANEPNW